MTNRSDEVTLESQTDDGPEMPSVNRRQLAGMVAGALGLLTLSACKGGSEGDAAAVEPIGQLAAALSGMDVQWVGTVLGAAPPATRTGDLATYYGPSGGTYGLGATVVIAQGCVTPGDGGGGLFYWITGTATDDGGTIIVPSNQPAGGSGYWKRMYRDSISVKWFGAVGDGSTEDAPAIRNAIQFAESLAPIDATGNTVYIPAGRYKITAPANGAALAITQNNVSLVGAGGPPSGGSRLLVVGSGGADCGILVERYNSGANPTIADYSQLRNLSIYGQSPQPRDLVVVHAENFTMSDCFLATCSRYGVLIESSTGGGVLLGVTLAPAGTKIFSDFWRLTNLNFQTCSTYISDGTLAMGAAVFVHGSDTSGGVAVGVQAAGCNISFADYSPAGASWIGCYSQTARVGYRSAPNTSSFFGCNSEDITPSSLDAGHNGAIVGGTLSATYTTTLRGDGSNIRTVDTTGSTPLHSYLDLQDGISFHTMIGGLRAPTGWVWSDAIGGGQYPGKWYVLCHNRNDLYTSIGIASESATGAAPGDLWLSGLQWWLGPVAGPNAARNKVVYGSDVPSSDTYNQGDICINTAPSSTNLVHLWRCIEGGTPGTWKAVALT